MTKRLVASLVAASVFTVGTLQTAQAAVIATDTVAAAQTAPAGSAQMRLHAMFDRAEAVDALRARGVEVEAAKARVASLTDAEAADLLQQIDDAPAGAANVLVVVAVVFVVLLITDILGFTRIFPFTKPIR